MRSLKTNTAQASCSTAGLWNTLEPGQWLNLEDVPSPFAHNECLLLCQVSKGEWVTWVPNHGEYILSL